MISIVILFVLSIVASVVGHNATSSAIFYTGAFICIEIRRLRYKR